MLSDNIRKMLFDAVVGDLPIDAFEEWVYANHTELEQCLHPDDYLALLCLNYSGESAIHDLKRLMQAHIDPAEFATAKMIALLNKAKRKSGELPFVLLQFYYLYCRGYEFLQELGLGYGLRFVCPYPLADSWEELDPADQRSFLDGICETTLAAEAERVIALIESGAIVLLHDGCGGQLRYRDFRGGLSAR